MKRLIILFFICIWFFHGFSGISYSTEVSGNIDTDTIWNLTDSPYILTGTVQVLQGAMLTIEPGVVVKFNNGARLNAEGNISAIGNKSQLITFTANGTTDSYYISFNENPQASSILEYCLIERCSGISNHGHVLSLVRCKFDDNHGHSSLLALYREEKYIVSESEFTNNTFDEKLISSGYNTIIKDNIFVNNNLNSSALWTGKALINAKSDAVISGNSIENNFAPAIFIDNKSSIKSNLLPTGEISNNRIINCGYSDGVGGGICVTGISDGKLSILDNTIIANRGSGLELRQYNIIEVKRNIFKNNRSSIASSIFLWNGNTSWERIIENNDIYGTVRLGGKNVDVYIPNNYWGTIDKAIIDERIYDYYDNTNEGKLIYTPFANKPFNILPTIVKGMPWLLLLLNN